MAIWSLQCRENNSVLSYDCLLPKMHDEIGPRYLVMRELVSQSPCRVQIHLQNPANGEPTGPTLLEQTYYCVRMTLYKETGFHKLEFTNTIENISIPPSTTSVETQRQYRKAGPQM